MLELVGDGVINVYRWMMEHLFLINIVFSLLIIFFQRRNPTTVWAWLLLLYFIPVLGFVLYLILGQNFRRERMFKMKEIEGEIKYAVRRQEESIYRKKLRLRDPELDRFKRLISVSSQMGERSFRRCYRRWTTRETIFMCSIILSRTTSFGRRLKRFFCVRRAKAWRFVYCSTAWAVGGCTALTGRALRRRESRWQNFFRLYLESCSFVSITETTGRS